MDTYQRISANIAALIEVRKCVQRLLEQLDPETEANEYAELANQAAGIDMMISRFQETLRQHAH